MNIQKEVADMLKLSLPQLRARFVQVIGEAPRSSSRVQLVRRIAWRLQAQFEGDLSERAKRRAEELAPTTDFRLSPPTIQNRDVEAGADVAGGGSRGRAGTSIGMPVVGASLTRQYKGKRIHVTVLDGGFEYEGTRYASLSAIAKVITGSHWNGRLFFGLPPYTRPSSPTPTPAPHKESVRA